MRSQVSGLGVQERQRAIRLTPAGGAAIAVVRLVGDGVSAFLRAHFNRPVAEGRCVHGTLSNGERVLDDPVVVLSGNGGVADLSLHGGPWVVRSVLELARRSGFEVDETPGLPLPEEAVDAHTEIAREVLQYLPMAATELAVRALLAQEAAWERFARSVRSASDIAAMLSDRSLHWLLHPPRVAIVGIPNAGKSTLANQLFAQERSITADLPGTTRDWVGEIANVDGLTVMLVDTPGLRKAQDPIELEAIERSREVIAAADLVVLVLDPTQPREPGQAALERAYPGSLRVLNKSDRRGVWDDARVVVRTVAITEQGTDALRNAIRHHVLGPAPFDVTRPRCWTSRQRELLNQALSDPNQVIA
jgi:small GTP-binding protein